MCTWIYYWGKNDHFCYYPPSDGRMRYFLGTFNILRPISLFLRVNNEGLCDGAKVRGMVLLAIPFFMFLEWRKNRHNIINFLNTWKIIKNEIAKRTIPLTFVPSHRPSLFTLRNKLMCLKGTDLSQEIFDPAITLGVKPKIVIFTPIWDSSAHNHIKGGLIKVSIINLTG